MKSIYTHQWTERGWNTPLYHPIQGVFTHFRNISSPSHLYILLKCGADFFKSAWKLNLIWYKKRKSFNETTYKSWILHDTYKKVSYTYIGFYCDIFKQFLEANVCMSLESWQRGHQYAFCTPNAYIIVQKKAHIATKPAFIWKFGPSSVFGKFLSICNKRGRVVLVCPKFKHSVQNLDIWLSC